MTVRHAGRSLRRTPVFTVTASLTLVIGLAAAIAIFAIVNGVLLRPLPYRSADRLIGAWHDLPPINLKKAQQTPSTWLTYKRLARTIEDIGIYQDGSVNVTQPGSAVEPQRVQGAWVSEEVIPVLGVRPLLGSPFTHEQDLPNGPNVALIGETMWRTRFASDPQIVGKTIEVNNLSREIIGVMPASFHFPFATTSIWLPLQQARDGAGEGFSFNSVARLKPGFSVA